MLLCDTVRARPRSDDLVVGHTISNIKLAKGWAAVKNFVASVVSVAVEAQLARARARECALAHAEKSGRVVGGVDDELLHGRVGPVLVAINNCPIDVLM